MANLKRILAGEGENYILPFLWLRDQSEETLRTEIGKIYDCGIRAVCLESRPHPDFGGPGWWHDFDIVLDEAKKREMKIWILDDAHFPTGQANGLIPAKYPERARKYAMMQYTDCVGPIAYASLDVNLMMTKQFTWMDFGKPADKPLIDKQELISVTAARLIEGDLIDSEILDLTDKVQDGWLLWDVPEGVWRICISFTTFDFGSNNEYINYVDHDSVATLIEAVYQLHYDHYAEEFGKTIAGFFSDEPGFYNVGGYRPGNAVGRKKMPLPWGDELQSLMEQENPDWKLQLPYLWLDGSDQGVTLENRYCYMDLVSRMYSKNFSSQLGDWCSAHGVEYIGHVIEDFDEHSRLGMGTGHYFRAMKGQHMAGIDDIGGQIIPGNPYGMRHGVTSDSQGQFYHFALTKMGASSAAIDPAKRGRLLCEAYGAYGWNFGVKNMKWLTDFLIFQGVNHLVPHAFSMAEYPDMDCPPHFYAGGNNPQYPYFAELMKYANRMCNLFNDGKNVPQVALIYPGEHDWTNECMKLQAPAQQLIQNQIDFEIIPLDVFSDREYYGVQMAEGTLTVNERTMKAIIVPQTSYIEAKEAAILMEAQSAGIPVIFVNSIPEEIIGFSMEKLQGIHTVALLNLADYIHGLGICDLKVDREAENLLTCHYSREQEIYGFFNTDLSRSVDVEVTIPVPGDMAEYDAMNNRLYPAEHTDRKIRIKLAPYESRILVVGNLGGIDNPERPGEYDTEKSDITVMDISKGWRVSKTASILYPDFPETEEMDTLVPISVIAPEFSGIMRYEKEISLPDISRCIFRPEYIYEVAEVFVNGISAGKRLTPSYTWDISGLCREGDNTIVVEVANTPSRDARKAFTPFGPEREVMEPAGMFGHVELLVKSENFVDIS